MERRLVLAIGLAVVLTCAAFSATSSRQEQWPGQTPTFRSGIDLVQLDVSVLDRDRHPVRDLKAGDFTVLEDGRVQNIVAFQAFDIPTPVLPATTWMREVAPDVVTNRAVRGRLVVVVLDDLMQRTANRYWTDVWTTATSSRVVDSIMDQLGPEDLVSVVYTEQNDRAQDFTMDRARIRAAIESFVARRPSIALNRYNGSCGPVPPTRSVLVLDELLRVSAALQLEPQRRKTVLLVSPGFRIRTERGLANTCEDLLSKELLRQAQRASINIYGIDPGSPGPVSIVARQDTLDDLKMLAESTGGRLIEDTKNDDPEKRVPGIFEENSSYYLLGFRSTNAKTDGQFRRLEVKVDRPGVEVRTRSGYYADRSPGDSAAKPSTRPAPSSLEGSVGGLLPVPDVPLRASVAPFAIARKPGAAIAVAIGVGPLASVSATGPTSLNVLAHVYDLDGNSVASTRTTIDVASAAPGPHPPQFDVLLRLDVPPGRYEIRVGTETSSKHLGSVYAYSDVPNFTKEPLSLSGLVVDRVPASRAVPEGAFTGMLPIVPTTDRQFASSDAVHAFMRVYQAGRERPSAATVAAHILDERNETVFEENTTLPADRFIEGRKADYMLTLPLARLPPGEYLLTAETTLNSRRDHRDLRFSVR